MRVHIRYFAHLRETFGVGDEWLDVPTTVDSIASLRHWLSQNANRQALTSTGNCRCALNQQLVPFATPIHENDEVAFFPPVTGG